jgi:hypothetical protein
VITYTESPARGSAGAIRIYDAATVRLVDTHDLALPPATAAALSFASVHAANAGTHTVTLVNASGQTRSRPAVFTVK